MKYKVFTLAIMFTIFSAVIGPQNAISADVLWAEVTIDEVYYNEMGWCTVRFTEINEIFKKKLFRAKTEHNKAILAVILTAQSTNKNLMVGFYDGTPSAQIVMAGIVNN